MTIFKFIEEYCKDIVDEFHKKKDLVDLSEFPHDGMDSDPDGRQVPVVYSGNFNIPLSDFFTLPRKDFLDVWKHDEAAETYDNYIRGVEMLEGEDVVNRVRNQILRARAHMEESVESAMDIDNTI